VTRQKKAWRIIAQELQRLGMEGAWPPESSQKGPEKVNLPRQLRAETTTTLVWAAQQLEMVRWG